MELHVGDKVPSFQGYDEEGNLISSDDLRGTVAVIYFYPKDDTPGCTKEACDFRDHIGEINARDVVIMGISPDLASSHKRFSEKFQLNFTLICDPQFEIAEAFHVVQEREKLGRSVERSTFIIDEKGFVRWIEKPVKVEDHVVRVMKALDSFLEKR
jgi:thioredoxin-dependent peroxiredoxin